ncbi:hypothetical protein WR25_14308 [Diploscapter pachys]|uniref:Uncharacterized protein n=1 Tax=Diploscapter pachys TaxID=2018661 RepID=A0A2A2KH25_9BILA|nr:hypothetical protein WR25_14308 [Diploscapter pachys]
MRMRGAWGEDGKTIFGKTDTPDGYFLLAGIDKKLPPEYSVMLIVIEAYDFSFDAFGQQGGVAVIDDIEYNASAIYNCRMIPHFEPPVNLTASTCNAVACDFESGDCMEKLEDAGFETSDERKAVSDLRMALVLNF